MNLDFIIDRYLKCSIPSFTYFMGLESVMLLIFYSVAVSAMPSIWKLQALLESAWSLGFDPLGASQISSTINPNKISSGVNPTGSDDMISADSRNLVGIVDSTACLGATDMVSLFGSIGIRSSIIECRAPSGPGGTHP